MELFNLIKVLFCLSVPSEYESEFEHDTNSIVMNRGRAVGFTIIMFEIALLVLMIATKGAYIIKYPHLCYVGMYLLMIMVVGICLVINNRIKNDYMNDRKNKFIIIFFTTFILYWSAAISVLDQLSYGQITVYIITIISIAVFAYLSPKVIFIIYTSCQLVFILVLPRFQASKVVVNGNLINSSVFVILSWVIARMLYKKRIEDFINKKTIEEKNEMMNIMNKKLQEANEKLKKLSITDSLSELNNRRRFNEVIASEWDRCRRCTSPLSIIFIDIDFFKAYNDKYGHQAGDKCIKQIAVVLKNFTRRSADFVARYGGEEFVVLLPHLSSEEAKYIAEDLRRKVEELKIEHNDSTISKYVTISLGINTEIPSEDITIEEFIERADKALYAAKQNNRNQVVKYKA